MLHAAATGYMRALSECTEALCNATRMQVLGSNEVLVIARSCEGNVMVPYLDHETISPTQDEVHTYSEQWGNAEGAPEGEWRRQIPMVCWRVPGLPEVGATEAHRGVQYVCVTSFEATGLSPPACHHIAGAPHSWLAAG